MSKPRRHQAARKSKYAARRMTLHQLEQLLFGVVEACCPLCASLGIPHFGPLVREAAPQNEERPRLGSGTPHDHSLELATESNNAKRI